MCGCHGDADVGNMLEKIICLLMTMAQKGPIMKLKVGYVQLIMPAAPISGTTVLVHELSSTQGRPRNVVTYSPMVSNRKLCLLLHLLAEGIKPDPRAWSTSRKPWDEEWGKP